MLHHEKDQSTGSFPGEQGGASGWFTARPIVCRRQGSARQLGDKVRQAGNALAVQGSLRRTFEMFDAVAPVCRRKGFLWRECDYAFQMDEFTFKNDMMHCLISPGMAA